MQLTLAQERRRLMRQSRANLSLGIIGLSGAAALIYPKAALLLQGDWSVVGTGAIANLALVFGSLMFLRNAGQRRREAESQQ